VDVALACKLYRTFADDLRAVIEQQRTFLAANRGRMTPQLDDVEAELTYLALREHRPSTVMELGTFHGWSTSWILSALRDNGSGHLHSFDRIDNVVRTVPAELAADRWTFVHGDIATTLGAVPDDVGYLFVDADHGRRFGRWYLANLFPRVAVGTPVSVHDVFHWRRVRPWSEGAEVLRLLDERGEPWFTAARRHAPANLAAINDVRAELGLTGARGTTANPMIFFSLPA
jgi:predicted O-methyltransferase YrrM